jgi:hypothetical protein
MIGPPPRPSRCESRRGGPRLYKRGHREIAAPPSGRYSLACKRDPSDFRETEFFTQLLRHQRPSLKKFPRPWNLFPYVVLIA